jgi:hypothetical protein
MRDLAIELGSSLLFPTICRYCGQLIYLYASPDGGFAIFDSLGKPWPKHVCAGVRVTDRHYQAEGINGLPDHALPIPNHTGHKPVRENQSITGVIARILEGGMVEVYDGVSLFPVKPSLPVRVGMMVTGVVAVIDTEFVLQVSEIQHPSSADVRSLTQRFRGTL